MAHGGSAEQSKMKKPDGAELKIADLRWGDETPEEAMERKALVESKLSELLELAKKAREQEQKVDLQEPQVKELEAFMAKMKEMGVPEDALREIADDKKRAFIEHNRQIREKDRQLLEIRTESMTGLLNKAGSRHEMNKLLTGLLEKASAETGDGKIEKFAGLASRTVRLEMDAMGLKPANDYGSHAVGDRLIKSIARAIEKKVDTGDPDVDDLIESWGASAREGGDEFSVMVTFKEAPKPEQVKKLVGALQKKVAGISLEGQVNNFDERAQGSMRKVFERFGRDFDKEFDPEKHDYYRTGVSVGAVNFGEAFQNMFEATTQEELKEMNKLEDFTNRIVNQAYEASDHRCFADKKEMKRKMLEGEDFDDAVAAAIWESLRAESPREAVEAERDRRKKLQKGVNEAVSDLETAIKSGEVEIKAAGAEQAFERLRGLRE